MLTEADVMKLFGETEKKVIGSRHGEKLYETLMTREERLRSTDMGNYFRISPDGRSLNYDKFYVEGQVLTQGDEAYTEYLKVGFSFSNKLIDKLKYLAVKCGIYKSIYRIRHFAEH